VQRDDKDYKRDLPVRKETIKEPCLISKEPCSMYQSCIGVQKSRIHVQRDDKEYTRDLPVRKETTKEPYLISKEPCSVYQSCICVQKDSKNRPACT